MRLKIGLNCYWWILFTHHYGVASKFACDASHQRWWRGRCGNEILDDIVQAVAPRFARVTTRWYVRGGIFTNIVAEHRKRGWKSAPRVDLADFPAESAISR